MIDINKTYKTRDNQIVQVQVHSTDLGGDFPVLASFRLKGGGWVSSRLTADGRLNRDPKIGSNYDLIEIKPRIKFTRWFNVYQSSTPGGDYYLPVYFKTKDEASRNRSSTCLMTVPVIIEGEEGEGL